MFGIVYPHRNKIFTHVVSIDKRIKFIGMFEFSNEQKKYNSNVNKMSGIYIDSTFGIIYEKSCFSFSVKVIFYIKNWK